MGASTHRVIRWATGNTGQRALREVIRDPILDLVGLLVYDSAKDGVDAGTQPRDRPVRFIQYGFVAMDTEPDWGLQHAGWRVRLPVGDLGPLTRKVMQYQDLMKQLVPTARAAQDWAPLAEFVSVDHFERIGTFLEVHDWQQYTEMLNQWARSIDTFETTVKRISELPELVYLRN
jgi:hypothetical protein